MASDGDLMVGHSLHFETSVTSPVCDSDCKCDDIYHTFVSLLIG
jgi:hypothetical protein